MELDIKSELRALNDRYDRDLANLAESFAPEREYLAKRYPVSEPLHPKWADLDRRCAEAFRELNTLYDGKRQKYLDIFKQRYGAGWR